MVVAEEYLPDEDGETGTGREVLRTVGRGILDDHMACGGKVPGAWLDERLSGHVLMAFDLWGEPGPGNPFRLETW